MTSPTTLPAHTPTSSPLAPLHTPVFRALWLATLASNVGTWMQDVGAAWLMTTLDPSALMVALVRASSSLPMFLIALPAGALADVVDRRRLLLVTQTWMLLAAATLGVLTVAGITTPWMLLGLTFALALGTAFNAPAWQATVPELVPRAHLHSAISLNSVSINLARSVGPAIGGLIIALTGPGATFLLNALSFIGVIAVLYYWKRIPTASMLPAERILGAMRTGTRYVLHAPAVKVALLREFAFVIFASSLWALLPSIARFELGRGPTGYGILLGFFGAGAVLAAALQPRLRSRLSVNNLISSAIMVFAFALLGLAWVRYYIVAELLLFIAGGCWLTLLSTFNASIYSLVPSWVRARVLAFSILTFFGAMALGSIVWGYVATHFGLPHALWIAAVGTVLALLLTRRYQLQSGERLDLSPSIHWPAPNVAETPDPEQGPVVVTVEYHVDSTRWSEFGDAMRDVQRIRRRDGAISWGLLRDVANPTRLTETFVVESWLEHLRQHERVTVADREALNRARAFHIGAQPPQVTHYLVESLQSQ